jgi:VanZ family protein
MPVKFADHPRLVGFLRIVWAVSVAAVAWLSLWPRVEMPVAFDHSDKLAHFAAYAWLGLLCFGAFTGRWAVRGAVLAVMLLALGLEVFQQLVPGRMFEVTDMAANLVGAATGMVAGFAVARPEDDPASAYLPPE